LEPAQIKECGAREGINQKVKVAVLAVTSVQNRPKDSRISGSALLDQASNFVAMEVQSSGRLQGDTHDDLRAFYLATSGRALVPFTSYKQLIYEQINSNNQKS